MCDKNGACVIQPLTNVTCTPPAEKLADRNVSMCQKWVCDSGLCMSVPLEAGLNCSHRVNESDTEAVICEISVCDGSGMCVSNGTSPFCVVAKKKKSKATAAIVGGVVGGGVLVLAGVAVAVFALGKAAPPVAFGAGGDAAAGAMATNPTYVQLAEMSNPTYE